MQDVSKVFQARKDKAVLVKEHGAWHPLIIKVNKKTGGGEGGDECLSVK